MCAKMILGSFFFGCVLLVLASTDNEGQRPFSVYETPEQIASEGFQSETHRVTTSDGYILTMYRIPHGRSVENVNENRTVVFLMHGLLSASYGFLALGAEYSLAYNLADAGFDVWMGNARGNKNSRYHVTLNPDDEEEKMQFFDFTFEEIGMLDLPAMIDYVLEYTGKEQLHYIGHSQGGTVFLVLASMLPEYNQKMKSVHLLAGVGYQEYFPDEELLQVAPFTDIIYSTALRSGIVELYPPNSTQMVPDDLFALPYRTADYCVGDLKKKEMCELFGVRYLVREFSPTDLPGAALKQIAHFGQNVRDRQFRRYSHGIFANLGVYGSFQPPAYDLGLITCPVTMHYTVNDALQDERDVLAMVDAIPNAISRKVARDSFLHEDFAAAYDAKELVTDYIIETIKNVEQEVPAEGTDTDVNEGDQDTGSEDVIIVDINTDDNDNDDNSTVDTDDVSSPVTDSAPTLSAVIQINLVAVSLYTWLN